MALDVTVGGANANSYASLAEYNTYASTRIPAATWFATATDAAKENSLIHAARILDASLDWTGAAVDSIQARSWPRSGMFTRNGYAIPATVNPIDLKNAQCELALQIGSTDLVSDNEAEKKGVSRVKAGSVEVGFQSVDSTLESIDAVSYKNTGPEFDYMRLPGQVRLLLVDTWYVRETVKNRTVVIAVHG